MRLLKDRRQAALWPLLAAVALAACSSATPPAPRTSAPPARGTEAVTPTAQPVTPAPEPVALPAPGEEESRAAEQPAPQAEAAPGGAEPSSEELTVVIDPGGESGVERPSLVEAASAERQRRDASGQPIAVIDNRSLSDYADVELTVSQPGPGPAPGAGATLAELERAGREEEYWRNAVLEARLAWREAADSIERLEGEAAALRRRFYAEDDPHYRDTQIKPAWDRAIEELRHARARVESAADEVDRLLQEGRRAGAMPGWLREGIDLEPERQRPVEEDVLSPEDRGIYEAEDPETLGDGRGDDGG